MEVTLTNLKNIRKASGIGSQEAVSKILGVSKGTYRNWEQGLNCPKDGESLFRLCELFNCSLDELYGRVPPKEHPKSIIEPSPRLPRPRPILYDLMERFAIDVLGDWEGQDPAIVGMAVELGKFLLVEGGDRMSESIGARIAELREEKGWSARQLARKADLVDESVLAIERGTGNPTLKTLEKIAGALGCEVADLVK